MPSLILTALSVMIIAIALVAGTSFVNPAMQSRVEVSRVLSSQYGAIGSAIASYKVENQGVRPSSLKEIEGYVAAGAMAGYGSRSEFFAWTIEPGPSGKPGLCLSFRGDAVEYGVISGFERFAIDADTQRPGTVSFGTDCAAHPLDLAPSGIAHHLNEKPTALSVRFEER
jgi:Flp pilus assembly pilin Flp